MTIKRDVFARGVSNQNISAQSKNFLRLNISQQNPWRIYDDYLDGTCDALDEIIDATYEDMEDEKKEADKEYERFHLDEFVELTYEDRYGRPDVKEADKEYEWLHSIEYTILFKDENERYDTELDEILEWINERESRADKARYQEGSLQYCAREALKSYINYLNALCEVNKRRCDCGYGDIDADIDIYGRTSWTFQHIEFCCCYENSYSDDSVQMVLLKSLQDNYKSSKDKIKPDLSSAYDAMASLRIKHDAYLEELKLVPV